MTKELAKIPTLQELYDSTPEMIKQNKLNIILNAEPKTEWIKTHPFVKNLKYIPIERVEYLLTMIFTKWHVEVKAVQLIANSVVVTIRLYVQNPITGEMEYQDGIGAMPIQVQKGSGAIEFDKMNSSAIQIGAPAAESYAVKDAAEKFGKIFGKDLNRKDEIGYTDVIKSSISKMENMGNHSIKAVITSQLKQLGCVIDTKEDAASAIKDFTGLEISDDTLIEISNRLSAVITEKNENN